MRIVLTGGGGLVGGAVARLLRARGDTVVALVRDPARAASLAAIGADIAADDLSSVARLEEHVRGADAVIHAAGSYRIGIRADERPAMWDANVGTATRVLDAAAAVGAPRIVYVSTVNVFGSTRGRIVDEAYRRDPADGFLSYYDETKFRAHELAEARLAAGAPIVIVLPSQVYGPGDYSGFGDQLARAAAGRLRYRAVDDVAIGLVHVDDLAAGIVAALDRGRVGEAYVLSGPIASLREAIAIAATVGGRRSPALRIPTGLLRLMVPLGRLVGQPNLGETIAASSGVTYCASAGKAVRELGFTARSIEQGLRDTFAANAAEPT